MAHFNRKYFTCTILDCDAPHYAKGQCRYHYSHLKYTKQDRLSLQGGIGGTAEDLVAKLLTAQGATVKRMPFNAPFDLLVNNSIRVEVKISSLRSDGMWHFNIHRHGLIKEECDWYVLVLEGLKIGLWVKRAPIGRYEVMCGKKNAAVIREQPNPLAQILSLH